MLSKSSSILCNAVETPDRNAAFGIKPSTILGSLNFY